MNVAFITRSTFYQVHGGNGVQVTQTARHLRKLGVRVDIHLAHENFDYRDYDLLHFFDLIRPAIILAHFRKAGKPFVISPTLVDYSEYDRQQRKGLSGFLFKYLPLHANEYIKTIGRWLLNKDSLPAKEYILKGQYRSIKKALREASILLPASDSENQALKKAYAVEKPYLVVPNGVDPELFAPPPRTGKDKDLVICAARIEGIKNQINLIRALNNTRFTLLLIGKPSPGHRSYYERCRKIAAANVRFIGELPQEQLLEFYQAAKVHVLPSWFETCGLSSLEAAAMGCDVVVSNRGFTRAYFGDQVHYCEPADINSIRDAVEKASAAPSQTALQRKVLTEYTWERAAEKVLRAYQQLQSKNAS